MVCTGNSCRSPIAEVLLKKRLEEKNLIAGVEVISAGTSAVDGMPASGGAIQSVKKYDTDFEGFRSKMLTQELCDQAHLILVMEQAHRDYINEVHPTSSDKILLLGLFLPSQYPSEIPDPVGGNQQIFDETTEWIDIAAQELINQWDSIKERFFLGKRIIAIGADHRGFQVKENLKKFIEESGLQIIDCGTVSEKSCDHPDFAFRVGALVSQAKADRGIIVCSTGHGMIVSANKVPGIRAVLAINEDHAALSRSHNNANVLTLAADFMEKEKIENIVRVWLKVDFLGGKYQRRVKKITDFENLLRNKLFSR